MFFYYHLKRLRVDLLPPVAEDYMDRSVLGAFSHPIITLLVSLVGRDLRMAVRKNAMGRRGVKLLRFNFLK